MQDGNAGGHRSLLCTRAGLLSNSDTSEAQICAHPVVGSVGARASPACGTRARFPPRRVCLARAACGAYLKAQLPHARAMAPRRPRARLALAAAVTLAGRPAAAAFVCPDANMASHAYCYCTSGCSVNGDTTFPWSPPSFPPPSIDLGADTVCASVTLPCLGGDSAYSALLTWLGVNGTVAPSTCVLCARAPRWSALARCCSRTARCSRRRVRAHTRRFLARAHTAHAASRNPHPGRRFWAAPRAWW